MNNNFNINYLDHVAIRVKDVDISIAWYRDTLGLKEYRFKEWGAYPVFMMAGSTGIAIFPIHIKEDLLPKKYRGRCIEHFAFNVSTEDLEKAQKKLKELHIDFRFQDHIYFHSIYFFDPDDHEVELTACVGEDPFL